MDEIIVEKDNINDVEEFPPIDSRAVDDLKVGNMINNEQESESEKFNNEENVDELNKSDSFYSQIPELCETILYESDKTILTDEASNSEICSLAHLKEEKEESYIQLNEPDSLFIEKKQSRTIQCAHCSKFILKDSLKGHIDMVHLKLKPFSCPDCDFKASRNYDLRRHFNARHSKLDVYHCSHCDFKTHRKGSIKTHIDFVHCKLKRFKCTECDYLGSTKQMIDRHVNAIHLKLLPFSCSQCKYKANQKSKLDAHIDTVHISTEKEFKCSECKYETRYKNDLKRHINNVHLKPAMRSNLSNMNSKKRKNCLKETCEESSSIN